MNYDFSIENSIEKIQNSNTKEYFTEVYQTFANGNYRSSIVMLYSVLICDLVYKLRDLRDIYSDTKAKKILDEIEDLQIKNPKSPEWESKLIEFISSRTTLLEASDIVAIEALQKFRHLSAHPILTNSDLLYSPNKDTVQALIRNILDGVLTNPPFFSNKIFDTFLNDLVDVKDKITEDDDLEKYLKSRYLKRLKDTDFKKLFRSLWKIVLNSDDQKSKDNRSITIKAIRLLLKSKKDVCLNLIKNEKEYYSNITKDESLSNLVILLTRFPEIYSLLDNPLQLLIDGHITKDSNLVFISWFKNSSLEKHLTELDYDTINGLKTEYILFLRKISIANNCLEILVNYLLNYFSASPSFDGANTRYNTSIVPILENLNLEQTKKLLELANDNYQIYRCIGMKYKMLRAIDEKYEPQIDKSIYTNLF